MGMKRDAQFQQQEETFKEPEDSVQGDFRDEGQQLREENALFRREIDQLRAKLVEKIRGQSKVIAGGQFRAASASPAPKVPTTSGSICTKCSTARARVIKAHQESEEAQTAAAELRKYVDKVEAAQQRLWEERSVQASEIERLRDTLAVKVEECILMERECSKLDKQMKMLQPENDIMNLLAQPLQEKQTADNATQCTLQQSCDEEIKTSQLHEIAKLRMEIELLVQQLDDREQELKNAFKSWEDSQKAVEIQKNQRDNEAKSWCEENSGYKRRIVELEQIQKTLRVSVQDLQYSHQKELQLLRKENQDLRGDVVARESELQQLKQQQQTESSAREQQQQTLVKALKARIQQKIDDVNRLQTLLVGHSAVKISNAAMKTEIEDLEEQVQTLTKEITTLTSSLHLQQQQAAEMAQHEREQLVGEAAEEQKRLSEALTALQQDNGALQTRISEVEAELAHHEVLAQRQKRSHARAMERLLESSLRMCVVAPTVNVQLNTNGANLAKSNSFSTEKKDNGLTSVLCRSAPQQGNIKRVIENDTTPALMQMYR
ncbi:hypothetical protein V7S43_008049 [Phytophthora oleae]|uniref:Uncharacterized protein n=1 Tax=Phytophthora oleae TaxID=2107226 RepID=A0ABD3FK20_9STRA